MSRGKRRGSQTRGFNISARASSNGNGDGSSKIRTGYKVRRKHIVCECTRAKGSGAAMSSRTKKKGGRAMGGGGFSVLERGDPWQSFVYPMAAKGQDGLACFDLTALPGIA